MVVERVEQGAVDQIRGPDHSCRPNQEAPGQAGQAIASAERGDAEEKLERDAEVLTVKDLLRDKNIRRIQNSAAIRRLSDSVSQDIGYQ